MREANSRINKIKEYEKEIKEKSELNYIKEEEHSISSEDSQLDDQSSLENYST